MKRRENFTESDRDNLKRILEYLPDLATLRRFADRIYWLFDTPKDFQQSSCRRAAVLRDPAFQAVPELAEAMEQLDGERFPKLMGQSSLISTVRRLGSVSHMGRRTSRILTRRASFDVALFSTDFITRPGIPWGNCFG